MDEVIDRTHPIYEHWKEVQDKLFETKKKRPMKYYLHPAKARSWMEGLLARAGQIVSKSGPAFTSKYKVKADGTFIDVDIVPVFHIGTCFGLLLTEFLKHQATFHDKQHLIDRKTFKENFMQFLPMYKPGGPLAGPPYTWTDDWLVKKKVSSKKRQKVLTPF